MDEQLIVARYGAPDSVCATAFEKWWLETERWAETLGTRPNEVNARYRVEPRGLVNGNAYKVMQYRGRIETELHAGNIEKLGLTRLIADWRFKALDWEFGADYGRFGTEFAMVSSGISLDALGKLPNVSPHGFVESAVRQSNAFLDATYGFAVMLPRRFMPACYVIGVASGEMPEEMVYESNAWMQFSARECDRTLRNVFGYNMVNPRHLDIDVGGQRLRDWICSSSNRGRIETQADGLLLWTFQEGDDQEAFLDWDYPPVAAVREELKRHGVFPWQRLPGVE